MASAEMRLAARRYPSISVGEKLCTSAMLSKPLLIVSGGRNALTSTSRSTRSRTDRSYSARLSRWNGRRPGFGCSGARASIFVSSDVTSVVTAAASGRRRTSGGGIIPSRSLWIIFSATSGFCSGCSASKLASVSPAVFALSLWHPTQYCLTSAFCASALGAAGVVRAVCTCETAGLGRVAGGACAPSERPRTTVVSVVKAPNETALIFQKYYTALEPETPSFHCPLSSPLVNECKRGRILLSEAQMARITLSAALALVVCLAVPRGAEPQLPASLQAMVETERAFAKRASEVGVRDSFLEFFADDAIRFAESPGPAKAFFQALTPQPASAVELTWAPRVGDVAASGELGYLTGPATRIAQPNPPASLCYFSIWKKQTDGTFKVFIDQGISTPEPVGFPAGFTRAASSDRFAGSPDNARGTLE